MKASFTSATGTRGRDALVHGDVDDAELAAMVAALWGVSDVVLVDSVAEDVDYDLPSILTGSRTWVRGHADAGDGPRPFDLFVKRIHSWRHSPAFASVPLDFADRAAASLPWRAELLAYRSDLRDRLPAGLTMPRAFRVDEREDETAVLWLEAVERDVVPWTSDDYVRAAGLLGRLSGSPLVAPLAALDPQPWDIQDFVTGRIGHTVLPGLHDPATWEHPLVSGHFTDLHARLLEVAGRLDQLAAEFARHRHAASHGDACPNNLLRRAADPSFTLIDFAFWRPQPVGFDLSQLLVGEIQVGREDADDLPARGEACLVAYAAGLAAEGLDVPVSEVLRGHAVSLVLFNGLPSLPLEAMAEHAALERSGRLTPEQAERLDHWAAQRAGIARYALDVLELSDA